MNNFKERVVEANGIFLNIAEAGAGPLVLLCRPPVPLRFLPARCSLGP